MYTYKNIHEGMEGIGERVKELRKKAGLTQEELGTRINSNQAVIQKIENGKSKMPRVLPELASFFQVNPGWILFGQKYCDLYKGIED